MITNAVGISAPTIAEFVMGRLLAVWKRFDHLADLQRGHVWETAFGKTFAGSTMAIVGFGAIGTEVAPAAKAFRLRVLAVRRTPTPTPLADEVVGPDGLHDVLGRADAVVLCAPSTAETADLFDADTFAAMKPGSVFCNVARGASSTRTRWSTPRERPPPRRHHRRHERGAAPGREPAVGCASHSTSRPTRRPRPERYLEDLYDLFADQLGRCPGRAAPQRRRPRHRLLSGY